MNSDDGKVIDELPAAGLVDDAVYDAQHKRIYVAGDQALDVFQQKDADHYELLGQNSNGVPREDWRFGAGVESLLSRRPASRRQGSRSARLRGPAIACAASR